jgi:transcriptional regulator with XRE-family HTH domain
VTEQPELDFAGLLRQLRGRARLTQEELAGAAGLSPRAVSDLERGIHRTAHKDTAVLLADALGVAGPARELFVAAARGRAEAREVLAARTGTPASSSPVAARARPATAVLVPRELLSGLPAQVSSFVGREVELAEVRRLVAACRLVTLTGSGGVGKTRLGLQAAAGLADGTGEGVWFADLATLGDPDLVPATVAHVLGIQEDPGRPLTGTLIEAVGERRLLVVLDNCEHVIDACAKLADALLRGCRNLALLATSREPLGIDGERVYRVPSMRIPADGDDPDALWASEAMRLLADRAAAQGVGLAFEAEYAVGRAMTSEEGLALALGEIPP